MLLLVSRHKEIKKQHVSAYHCPLSGFILKSYSVSVIQLLKMRIGGITLLQNSFSRLNLMLASDRLKHVVS